MKNAVRRGNIFWADLDPVKGSEQGKTRPVLIIQNDVGNENSPVTIVACITTNLAKKRLSNQRFYYSKRNRAKF